MVPPKLHEAALRKADLHTALGEISFAITARHYPGCSRVYFAGLNVCRVPSPPGFLEQGLSRYCALSPHKLYQVTEIIENGAINVNRLSPAAGLRVEACFSFQNSHSVKRKLKLIAHLAAGKNILVLLLVKLHLLCRLAEIQHEYVIKLAV